uniref:Uncharacterized protein n=1 Tax=Monopterus albus TaxID=43700 RepID=A0A3Q3J428_MONAL
MVKKKLNSINDLRNIDFDWSVPKHSLLLLHWFANVIYIDSQNNIWLTFDPNTNYGSHHYGNFDGLLEPSGYQYFTVGNLNEDSSVELPDYVAQPKREYKGRNSDRIIFRVGQQITGRRRIDRVYLTQHKGAPESPYDPDHTYEVTTNLLREIREFGTENFDSLLIHSVSQR